jgi:hypothetical protein
MKMNLDEVTKSRKLWGEPISCSGNVKKAWRTPEFILAMYSTLYGRHDSYTGLCKKTWDPERCEPAPGLLERAEKNPEDSQQQGVLRLSGTSD